MYRVNSAPNVSRHPDRTATRQVAYYLDRTEQGRTTFTEKMKRKIDSAAGRALYAIRLAIGEPPFANIRSALRLDRFIEAQTNFEISLDYMEKQDFKNAISPLKKALSINPDPPQIYGNLGLCYACLGEKQIALDYLDKALELDPKYEVALVNRSLVEKLETGEKLDLHRIKAVNYYLDYLKPKE